MPAWFVLYIFVCVNQIWYHISYFCITVTKIPNRNNGAEVHSDPQFVRVPAHGSGWSIVVFRWLGMHLIRGRNNFKAPHLWPTPAIVAPPPRGSTVLETTPPRTGTKHWRQEPVGGILGLSHAVLYPLHSLLWMCILTMSFLFSTHYFTSFPVISIYTYSLSHFLSNSVHDWILPLRSFNMWT